MIKIAVISAISILGHCVAHLTLEHPKPYGIKTLNNSPLNKTGADFPCKQRNGVYEIAEMNNWRAGETQTVSFLGTAVHGGGSCQFSLTTDRHPTKDSRWKVVHSIVGGCPASVDGNLVPGQQPDKFGFTLSPDLPSGDYTFAWTWFNRRGYREMYMNCAPISVVGAPANDTFLTSLPDIRTSSPTTGTKEEKIQNRRPSNCRL
ncbi:hypothetical protein HBI60_256250 [Parastagonospora nodorum]|nr:hypothetical protein HBI60_256250 [Parastagonospora nodorum]